MLESIGFLTVVALGIYLLFKFQKSNEENSKERKKMIENNPDYQSLINRKRYGNLIISDDELEKQISEIIKDPEQIQKSLDNIKRSQDNKNKELAKLREKRKIGYKYQNEIFEIFDVNYRIDKSILNNGIKTIFNLNNNDDIDKLIAIWIENNLIQSFSGNIFEVGFILENDKYKIDSNDINRDDWLKIHNKKLIGFPKLEI